MTASRRASTTSSFGAKYAHYYDLLYADKGYAAECDYITRLFRDYSRRKIVSVLDIACGTGGHALILARRGYVVHGADASNDMLALARQKAAGLHGISFEQRDMRRLGTSRKYDACVCMFTALGYVTKNAELRSVFNNLACSLREGGVFIFDVWYGPSVLLQGPRKSRKEVRGEYRVVRRGVPELDHAASVLKVTFHVKVLTGGRTTDEFDEVHRVRYFFVPELREMLESAGFELLSVHPFMHPERKLGLKDWNATFVARRRAARPSSGLSAA